MIEIYKMFAHYNQWANTRLYDAVAPLPDADYRMDHGAFFRSLHGTLNHLVAADRIWMKRFTGAGDAPPALDTILHEDFADLRAAREAEDRRIIAWIESLNAANITASFTYRTITNPRDITQPLAPALSHFFNHETHHRGQAHALLTRITGDAPSFDLISFQRETGMGLS